VRTDEWTRASSLSKGICKDTVGHARSCEIITCGFCSVRPTHTRGRVSSLPLVLLKFVWQVQTSSHFPLTCTVHDKKSIITWTVQALAFEGLRYFCLLESVSSYLTVLVLALVIERKVIKNTRDSLSLCLALTLKLLQPRCNHRQSLGSGYCS
jgi:hypothetical protein